MIIYVDIDNTICSDEGGEYQNARCIRKNLEKVNRLYEKGHTIVYWSARGTVTGKDWLYLTREQLNTWGAKYHQLSVGNKPHYDLLIDDKSKRIEEI